MTSSASLTLTGEQHAILTLPPEHPVLIKGAAGSGKTTVAVYRAKHLLRTYVNLFQPTRVALISYTNSLVNCARRLLGEPTATVTTIHRIAYGMIATVGRPLKIISKDRDLRPLIAEAVKTVQTTSGTDRAILSKSYDFYMGEIAWIKGNCIDSLDAYLATPRTGRGTAARVTAQDRQLLWQIFERYQAAIQTANALDWNDVIRRALDVASQPGFSPPYSHIVVDEAQDNSFAQLSLVARLVSPATNSITLIADAAQRIYQSGFSWANTGIRVVGARSVELRRNYRNTRQIAAAAISLLGKEEDRSEFTESHLPDRDGPKPILHWNMYATQNDVSKDLVERLQRLPPERSVMVAAPTNREVLFLADALRRAGFDALDTRDDRNHNECGGRRTVWVSTLHSAKGMQFDHVFLHGLRETEFPAEHAADDADAASRARKALYVGMTRASQTLTILGCGLPSPFLYEIDPDTLDGELPPPL